MFSNGEIVFVIILIIIGLILVMWTFERVCTCIERCAMLKSFRQIIDKATMKNGQNEIDRILAETLNNLKK